MSTSLQIKTFSPTSHKIKAVIYGASGSGKTHFAATTPKPIFASAESGLLSTIGMGKEIPYVEIKTLDDLKKLLVYLRDEKHDFETVVIDSISEINEIIKEDIEKRRGRSMQLQDWGELAKHIKGILRGFRDLPMHTIFIAQELMEKDGQKIAKIVPSLNGKAAQEIAYFMDIVAYAYIGKSGEHLILVTPHEKYLTKDRSGRIANNTEPDFMQWEQLINKVELSEEKTVDVEVSLPSDDQKKKPAEKRITPEQTKELLTAWNEYMILADKDMAKSEAIRAASLNRDFGKTSATQLTFDEAADFISRMKKKNAELVASKKESPQEQGAPAEEEPSSDDKPSQEVQNESNAQSLVDEVLGSMIEQPKDETIEVKPEQVSPSL